MPPGRTGGSVGPRIGLDHEEKRKICHCRESNPGGRASSPSYADSLIQWFVCNLCVEITTAMVGRVGRICMLMNINRRTKDLLKDCGSGNPSALCGFDESICCHAYNELLTRSNIPSSYLERLWWAGRRRDSSASVPRESLQSYSYRKNAIFWDVAPCRSCERIASNIQGRKIRERGTSVRDGKQTGPPVENTQLVAVCYPPHTASSLADFSTLKMEAIRSSETSVHTRSTRRHIPEDGILHSHCCENLKSYLLVCSHVPTLFERRSLINPR
jgi:hypothetical protein